ncbi:MAG TPA: hypothetical protein VKK79_05615 [Candidatus Lokiarchaeia archaeon]|nr:hypothetical protein [Candidatus Lokiarchaeia archaeon]
MEPIIVLSHFHRKMGPVVFYSFPERMLDAEQSCRIAKMLDEMEHKGPFARSLEEFQAINYNFEIQPDPERISKELFLISLLFEEQVTPEVEREIAGLLRAFTERMKAERELYNVFYLDDLTALSAHEKKSAAQLNLLIKSWARELQVQVLTEFFQEAANPSL